METSIRNTLRSSRRKSRGGKKKSRKSKHSRKHKSKHSRKHKSKHSRKHSRKHKSKKHKSKKHKKEKKHRKHSKSDSHVTTISRQDIEMGEKKSMDIEGHLSELNQINQISRDIAINLGTSNLDTWNAFINLASSALTNKMVLKSCNQTSCSKCKDVCDSVLRDYVSKCTRCVELSDNEHLRDNTMFQENLDLFKHTLSVTNKMLNNDEKEDSPEEKKED